MCLILQRAVKQFWFCDYGDSGLITLQMEEIAMWGVERTGWKQVRENCGRRGVDKKKIGWSAQNQGWEGRKETLEVGGWRVEREGKERRKEVRELCVPLGSHHSEAFSIQELGVQLSPWGTDHTHSVKDPHTHTHIHKCTHYPPLTHTCTGAFCWSTPQEKHTQSWLIILSYGLHMVMHFYCYDEIWILRLSEAA